MKIIFINNIPAPFMVQFAGRMNQFNDLNFYLIAIKNDFSYRGKHWQDDLGLTKYVKYYSGDQPLTQWVEQMIDQIKPDIVFTGINRGPVFNLLIKKKKADSYKFGKWNEPPTPMGLSRLVIPFRNIIYKSVWRKELDFLLAIDERAVNLYRDFVSGPEKVFFFPYYEDSAHAAESKKPEGPVRFLFSGRLYHYHNIRGLASAVKLLNKKYPGQFSLIVSASGKCRKYLDKTESESPGGSFITYDIDFETWEDRLRPFRSSHVLILPSYRSGWGLVVNEALNLGLPVITTWNVGAARYLVDHMINGMIIKPTVKDIFHAMEYYILNPGEITRMSKNALDIDKRYSLDIGASRLKDIFDKLMKP